MDARLRPVPNGRPTFLNTPRCEDLAALDADIAVIGVPYGVPYGMEGSRQPSSTAPDYLRQFSLRMTRYLGQYEFDFGGDLFAGREVRIVDCGDVAMEPGQYDANSRATTEVIQTILERGAVPFVLGGDHSIPIPVMRAYRDHGPIYVVQIDAHLDWRDEVGGVREGLSSPMRRASELPFVGGMAQIGLRGVGSARQQEVDDARDYGSLLIPVRELHRDGVEAVLDRIPQADRYYITLDADGLDPSIAPAVLARAFGGVTYDQASELLRGVAAKGHVVGLDVVEVVPSLDVGDLTSRVSVRLMMDLIGGMAHAGQIGSAKR